MSRFLSTSLFVWVLSALALAAPAAAQDAGAAPATDADGGVPAADADGGAPPADADGGAPDTTPPPDATPPPETVEASSVDAAAQFAQTATLDHPPTDETVWNISAGATLNTGNARSFAGNAGTHFSVRRGSHQVAGDFQFVEGFAQVRNMTAGSPDLGSFRGTTLAENASNVTLATRYDYFLSDADALFFAIAERHDRFAGLELRTQAQLGYLRNLYAVEKHKLWAEVGVDVTYDYFWNTTRHDPAMPLNLLATDRNAVSARLYLGYDNHLNDALTLTTGVEFLLRPYAVVSQGDFQIRLNWITQLNVKVDAHFSLGLGFTLRYDSVPPGFGTSTVKDELDTITVLNLIYTLL